MSLNHPLIEEKVSGDFGLTTCGGICGANRIQVRVIITTTKLGGVQAESANSQLNTIVSVVDLRVAIQAMIPPLKIKNLPLICLLEVMMCLYPKITFLCHPSKGV